MTRFGRRFSVIVTATLVALPLYWAVVGSLLPEAELFEGGSLFPKHIVFEHYQALFDAQRFWVPIWNSIVVASATTALCVPLGAIAAYALARLRFPGKSVILGFVLAVTMFPQISIVSPLYLLLRTLGLIDTYPGLVLPYLTFAMPLSMWLLVGTFRALPAGLEEAAYLDGASRWRTLVEIVFPLALPGLATTAILTFIYCWNEFLFALSFTVGAERRTVPVAIALFRGQYRVPWGQILAAAVVATLPVAALVLAFQRRIVRGLTAGAIKG